MTNTSTSTRPQRSRLAVAFALGVLGATASALMIHHMSVQAAADFDPATESMARLVPYEGVLSLDGALVDGPTDLRFALYDDTNTEVWSEEYTAASAGGQAQLRAGYFSVMLGSSTPIESTIIDAEPLFVRIAVSNGSGGWTELSGQQELASAPFAVWTPNAGNMDVGSEVRIGAASAGEAGINVDVSDKPQARFGHLTIDSLQSGLGNINVGAAYSPSTSDYRYTDNRPAMQMRLLDTTGPRFVLNRDTSTPVTGDPVTWASALQVQNSGRVAINKTWAATELDVAGDVRASGASLSGSATVNALDSSGNLSVGGQFLTSGVKPIVTGVVRADVPGNPSNDDTGINAGDYHCMIGGWRHVDRASSGIYSYQLWTEVNAGTWHVRFEYLGGADEAIDVSWICLHNALVDSSGGWLP